MRPIQGQYLRLSTRREVTIYLRDETLWIADFVDGHGQLFHPAIWFRFNCGAPGTRDAHRRTRLESGLPLCTDIVSRIEDLHRVVAEPGPAPSVGDA